MKAITQLCNRNNGPSNLVHELAFGTQKNYIAPYGKITHGADNLSYNCDMKSSLDL